MLRSPDARDAAQRIAFLKIVNAETPFMARGAEDSPEDEQLVAEMLADALDDECVLEIAAFFQGKMVACGGISPVSRAYPRKRHRAVFGICVQKAFWGQGLATAIFKALEGAAGKMGYTQIELTVVSENQRAIGLYEKCGFAEVGRMPDGLKYEDGACRDEIWMMKRV